MTENTIVSLNLQSPNISTIVYAVQNDKLSRHIVAQLRDGSAPWTPPAGALPTIRYLKPDGTAGFYDSDEDNNAAIVVSGSTATITIVEQALTVPGDVYMQLNFYGTDGSKLTTFCWLLRVQKSVLADATIVSSDYYNTLTATLAQVAADRAAVEAIAASITLPWPISSGGTDATTASAALANLGGAPLVRIPGMADNTMAALLSTLNYGTTTATYIPIGASLLVVGNSSNANRVALFCLRLPNDVGMAITLSPYTALNGKSIRFSSGTWAEE